MRRHIEECTDCRVLQQRAARLQQLLGLKRHEQPGADYFDNFVGEFHQRLQAEAQVPPAWWRRWAAAFRVEPARVWRFSFAGAIMAFFAFSVVSSRAIFSASRPATADALQATAGIVSPLLAEVSVPASRSTPAMAVASVLPRSAEPSSAGSVVIIPAAAQSDNDEASAPRYVLDRITPASYEVASIHF
jgi:predicted anti-sigma-YlaC factor YlaD